MTIRSATIAAAIKAFADVRAARGPLHAYADSLADMLATRAAEYRAGSVPSSDLPTRLQLDIVDYARTRLSGTNERVLVAHAHELARLVADVVAGTPPWQAPDLPDDVAAGDVDTIRLVADVLSERGSIDEWWKQKTAASIVNALHRAGCLIAPRGRTLDEDFQEEPVVLQTAKERAARSQADTYRRALRLQTEAAHHVFLLAETANEALQAERLLADRLAAALSHDGDERRRVIDAWRAARGLPQLPATQETSPNP